MHPEIINKLISLALLAGGIVLIVYGTKAPDPIGSGFSHLLPDSPTAKTLWLLISGVAVSLVGATGLLRRSKTP